MLAYFDGVKCTDYGLTLLHVVKGFPEPKTNIVDIPYANGSLDLTDYFGAVKFEDREIELTFECLETDRSLWEEIENTLFEELHGQRMHLQLQDDMEHYWDGRCSVGAMEDHGSTFGITMSFLCAPYKIEVEDVQNIS